MFCLEGLNFRRIIILNTKAPQSFKLLGTVCPTMQHSSSSSSSSHSSSSSNCSSSRGDGGGGVGQKLKKN